MDRILFRSLVPALLLLGLAGCGEPAKTRPTPVPVESAAGQGKAGGPAPSGRSVAIPMH